MAEEFLRLFGANSCIDEQQIIPVFNQQAAHGPRAQIVRICFDVAGPKRFGHHAEHGTAVEFEIARVNGV
jgi:hypothetical protein